MDTMKTGKLNLRVVAATALALVMSVALAGIALAHPGHGNGAKHQYGSAEHQYGPGDHQYGPSDHQYGPSDHQYGPGEKLTICHITRKGNHAKTLTIGAKGAAAHLRHHRNDHAGACTADDLARNKHKNHGQGQNENNDQSQNESNDNGNGKGKGKGHD